MGLILLLLAAGVLAPPIWLLKRGYEKVYLKMHLADRRGFLIGFWGIIVINALLFGTLYFVNLRVAASPMSTPVWIEWGILLSPWVINGGVLILAINFRPYIATGIISSIGFLVLWGVLSLVLIAVSCGCFMGTIGSIDSLLWG